MALFAAAFQAHVGPLVRSSTDVRGAVSSPTHTHTIFGPRTYHKLRFFRTNTTTTTPIRHAGARPKLLCPRSVVRASAGPATSMPVTGPAWGVWAVLIGAATGGLLSNRTRLGAALSPPIVTTLATLLLSNLGLIPSVHPAYTVATKVFVPLAIPMLLFSADLRKVFRDTGRLLPAFAIGTLATAVSIVLAYKVFPLTSSTTGAGWKVAAALCSRHIGGAVNFVSTADALNIPPESITVALAADNLILSAYFVLLFALAKNVNDPKLDRALTPTIPPAQITSVASAPDINTTTSSSNSEAIPPSDDAEGSLAKISVETAGICLTISACICYVGGKVALYFAPAAYLGVIPTITLLALALTTMFPGVFSRRFSQTGNSLGIFLMQVFFAATGASGGSLAKILLSATQLFAFIIFHLAIHLAILLAVGRFIFRLHPAELLVASNANVGGPATALAMAAAKDWHSLRVPALLIGVFGYSIATFVGLAVGHVFLKP